jgi:hypothetical protein
MGCLTQACGVVNVYSGKIKIVNAKYALFRISCRNAARPAILVAPLENVSEKNRRC